MENYSIRVENVFKHFEQKGSSSGMGGFGKKKKVKAVDGISMCVKPGEIIGIIGESGCGKSTLGKLLIKLEDTSSGQIFVDGKEINKFYKEDKLKFRREVQMVFQNPFDTFDPRYTIQKILMEVLDIHHIGENKEEKNKIIVEGLESVELKPAEDYMDRRPHELSGGQLQRISILRAMLLKPKILISDEPVSMLDVSVRADVIRMLQNLARENNTTLLFISHDINTVRKLIEEAGYTADENGMYFSVELDAWNEIPYSDIGTVIKDNLKEIGIDAKLNITEMAAWNEKVWINHDYDVAILGGFQGPDAGGLSLRFASDGSMNIYEYKNDKMDQVLADGRVKVGEEERKECYVEAQRLLVEDLPMIPLSEMMLVTPYYSYVKGHPLDEDTIDKVGYKEYTYVWLDK